MTVAETPVYDLVDHSSVIGLLSHSEQPYVLRVRDLPADEKPREKLLRYGPGGLSSAELLAVIWGVGTKREELMTMTRRVLKEYGDQAIIHERNSQRLAKALDIPEAKACQLVACFELGRRAYATQNGQPLYIRTALQAYEHVRAIATNKKEQLRGLYLNARYEVVHDEVISVGSLTANIVHPREVFRPAIEHGAVAVVVAHNHPSGSVVSTTEDREVTEKLIAAGQILGIELLDHLVVTQGGYHSVLEDLNE